MTEILSKPALKMKDLEIQTGVSREAIHFYLREGLLPEPDRPKPNVALYSDEHVVRIQTIKRLQRDRALPLSEIKVLLSNFDYSALPISRDFANFELALHSHVDGHLPGNDQTLAEVSEKTGLSLPALNELIEAGVISVKFEQGQQLLDFRDVGIVESWSRLLRRGFGEKPAYNAEFLQRYAEAINPIAEAVVATFFDEFSEVPTPEAADLAAEGIGMLNEILVRMHTQALMRALTLHVERD